MLWEFIPRTHGDGYPCPSFALYDLFASAGIVGIPGSGYCVGGGGLSCSAWMRRCWIFFMLLPRPPSANFSPRLDGENAARVSPSRYLCGTFEASGVLEGVKRDESSELESDLGSVSH